MNKERLLKLADFLLTVDESRFDMSTWATRVSARHLTWGEWTFDCDTAGCAAGWATTVPEFREAGFRLDKLEPYYQGHMGFRACVHFFGLTDSQVTWIFDRFHYEGDEDGKVTPEQVHDRILELVEWES